MRIGSLASIVWCMLSIGLSATTLEQIQRDERGRILLFCSAQPLSWRSELSADKRRILLMFPGLRPSAELRPRMWSDGLVREVYPKRSGDSLQLYVTLAAPSGYSTLWLPYSRCLLLTLFSWEELPPEEELYHSALLALELRSESVAESLLTQAADRGSADAAAVLAGHSLAAGKPLTALRWLRQAWERSTLPEPYGIAAHLAALSGQIALSHQLAEHFRALTGRPLPPPPPVPIDSSAALTEAFLLAPLEFSPTPSDSVLVASKAPPDTLSPPPPPATGSVPDWLLLWSPLFFTIVALFAISSILRTLLRVLRKPSPSSVSASPTAFPGYVREALQHYRAAEDRARTTSTEQTDAVPSVPNPHETSTMVPPPVHAQPPEERELSTPTPELAQLWRQRLRQRSAYLQQRLSHLGETLPATPEARQRLARRLRIPSESLELRYRLHSVDPERLFARFRRTQEPPSFVSAAGTESHSSVQG